MKLTKHEKLKELVEYWLEEEAFEEFLERFDITPVETVVVLYESGMISDDILDELSPT